MIKLKHTLRNTSTTGAGIFKLYCAVKNHMLGKFNIDKYGFSIKVTNDSYNKRSDRVFFERISNKLTLNQSYEMMVSNFAANPNALTYEIAGVDAYEFYLQHSGYLESFSSHFKNEVLSIFVLLHKQDKKFKDLFSGEGHPVILQMALRSVISIETFIVLNRLIKFIPVVDLRYGDDILWHEYKTKAVQYESLLTIDDELAYKLFVQVKEQHKTEIQQNT